MKKALILLFLTAALAVALAVCVGAKTVTVWNCDSTAHVWGDGSIAVGAGVDGNAVSVTQDSDELKAVVICTEWNANPINVTTYFASPGAYLHVWIYVDDETQIIRSAG